MKSSAVTSSAGSTQKRLGPEPGWASARPPARDWPAARGLAVGWVTPNFTHHYGRIGENFASPAVADADGDGRPEIVAGFPDGNVYAWHAGAAQPFLTFTGAGAGAVQASPSLVD